MDYDYVLERLEPQLKYYKKQSRKQQRFYHVVSVLVLISTALIPVFSINSENCAVIRYIVAILGATTTVLNGILLLYKPQDKWVECRSTANQIERELAKYHARIDDYSNLSDGTALSKLAENCEMILATEHSEWSKTFSKSQVSASSSSTNS